MNQYTQPSMLNRRQTLGVLSAGMGACLSTKLVAASVAKSPVVDTHLHCFAGPNSTEFPYHVDAPYAPDTEASPEMLLRLMDGAGIDHAIVVHPEPYQDDHRYLEHCLDVGNGRLKGTCLFFADEPKSLANLPEFLSRNRERIVATRLHAYAPGRLPTWGFPELDKLWKTATEVNIAMQLHFEPRYAKLLDTYVRRYQDTRVLIDHLGRPMQGTAEEYDVVLRWSELPNTIMKFSSIPRQDQYPHRDPAPIMQRLVSLWGTDRIMYGGGFSADATAESYRNYREQIASMLPDLSTDDLAKIYGGNASRLFGF